MRIAKAFFTRSDSKIKIKIWEGVDYPEEIVFEKDMYYFEMEAETENFIRLDTLIYVNKNFFVGYEINYSYPADTFAVFTAVPRGEDGANSAYCKKENQWLPLTNGEESFNTSLSIKPVVMNYYPPDKTKPEEFPVHEVTIYPNPTYQNLQVLFRTPPAGNISLSIYDIHGRLVLKGTKESPEPNFNINISNLYQGMYLLKITYEGGEAALKFVKL
ncbi:hypothetical protein ES705_26755 [subsurface metagenome]